MEKKISSIKYGPYQFYMILSGAAFIAALGGILLILNLLEESIMVFIVSLLVSSILIIMKCNHFLEYIMITEEGIKSKKQFYSWDDVCITVGYSRRGEFIRNTYIYQFYLEEEFLRNKDQIKNCKKKGLFMDIDKKRLELVLQYYKKSLSIVEEMRFCKDLLQIMKEHNKQY